MSKIEKDEHSGTDTTGHEWDGIKELNTPLPRWWLWTFYATIVWAIGYCIAFPSIPLITESTKGLLGYSSRAEVEKDIAKAKAGQEKYLKKISALPLEDIVKDSDLSTFAVAGGRSAYQVNCVQCHGTGAAGSIGYPNLNDDDWLWGGKLENIYITIKHGIRFEQDEDTRASDMPAFGKDEVLNKEQIKQVSEFVLSLSKSSHDTNIAAKGAAIFKDNCASCHGEKGEGNQEVGAPRLNDAIWLYGGDRETIIRMVSNPKNAVMPAWAHRLDDVTIKQLAIYIQSLDGTQAQ
ncbi:MAG: cytochrome-c oxidase, cbb3-type subunit III [Methyloligellaceae bacterium]